MATIIDGSLAPRGKKKSFPNGMEWYESNITSGKFSKPYYGNNLWLVPCVTTGSASLYYSIDGKSWIDTGLFKNVSIQGIMYANGLWIIACNEGLYYSYSGKVWTKISSISGVCYIIYNYNGLWVTSNDSKTYYSMDGLNWTESASNVYGLYNISAANGLWLASNIDGMQYYSSDGKSWVQGSLGNFDAICNSGGLWVAGSGGGKLSYSSDGKTWTLGTNINSTIYTIINAQGIWIAGARAGIWYSIDGKAWYKVLSKEVISIYNANGIWIAGASDGIYYSVDGKQWENGENAAPQIRVLAANGMWVAATGNGLYYSPTWEVSIPPRTVSEEWVLKSSITTSSLNFSSDSFAKIPWDCEFSSGLADYDQFVLVHNGGNMNLGDKFTV